MGRRRRWPRGGDDLFACVADALIIDHTEVPAALRGRGVGQALVERAVLDARREGFRIIPLCPFAKAQFERHSAWRDVLST